MQKTSPPKLFDHHRVVAKLRRVSEINKPQSDFLSRIAADTLSERLEVTNRSFETVVDLFSRFDCMADELRKSTKAKNVISIGLHDEEKEPSKNTNRCERLLGQLDTFPFAKGTLDLVTSVIGLHWSNDLPGMMTQIRNALKPDGLFLAAIPGNRTLTELRECLIQAETELTGSVSLRVDTFGEVRQLGSLLQRAGFALPVVDTDILTIRYATLPALIDDLRAMGMTSSLANRTKFGPRNLFTRTEEIYNQRYRDSDGRIRATFELVFLSGWAPDSSQQKPLKPGSAQNRLGDFL
ncbi:MAG: methyltransferase domain-containing protein [Rhizobiaceae bacterium]